jgi:hypothetical protein
LFEFKRYVDIGGEGSISGAMSKMTSQVSQDRGKYHLGEVQESPCQEPTVPKMAYSPCAENSATCLGAEGDFASDSTYVVNHAAAILQESVNEKAFLPMMSPLVD